LEDLEYFREFWYCQRTLDGLWLCQRTFSGLWHCQWTFWGFGHFLEDFRSISEDSGFIIK